VRRHGAPLLVLLASVAAACNHAGDGGLERAADAGLPASDDEFRSIASAADHGALLDAVTEGLQTKGKGPDFTRFIVVRAGDRHVPGFRPADFTCVVGGGVTLPVGAMRVRRQWLASGMIDGRNEQLQTMGLSVVVEPGTPRPFAPAIFETVSAFCRAVAEQTPIHPDCVVAMSAVPYANQHEAGADEEALAAAARAALPVPATHGTLTIVNAGGDRIAVSYERRDTPNGIQTGMMMRRRFDGENRGMLFVYKWAGYRHFHMRNCYVPIDVAYVLDGKIDQVEPMTPEAGTDPAEIPSYPSRAAVKYALEMPAGWFAAHDVAEGAVVELE